MRRPPIACRRAVQSLQHSAPQHIWIPDEVLSLAVHRFFHGTCPQQKRYGSNVPGPLEARRRATKRRMTASAGFYPQDSFPTSFSLGALFGHRSQPQASWRYEPPSLPKFIPPLPDAPSHGWLNDQYIDTSSINQDRQRSLATQPAANAETYDNKAIPTDANNIEECLNKFKASLRHTDGDFYGDAVQEAFMKFMPASPFVWKYFAAVIQHLHELKHDPRSVISSLLQGEGQLLRVTNPIEAVDECQEFMNQLDLASRSHLVGRIFAVIAHSVTEAKRSTSKSHDLLLLRLIQYIERQTANTGSQRRASHTTLMHDLASKLSSSAGNALFFLHSASDARVIRTIHSVIRNVACIPSDFARAELGLLYVPRAQLLTLVPVITSRIAKSTKGSGGSVRQSQSLDIWLRMLNQVDLKVSNKKALLKAALHSLAECLRTASSRSAMAAEHFVKALLLHQDLDIQFLASAMGPHTHRVQDFFVDVLLQVQTQPLLYNALLDLSLPILAEHAGLRILLRCIRAMEEQQLPLSTRMNFDSFLEEKVAALSSSTSNLSESQIQVRAVVLQACEKLVNTLSRMGHALPARLEQLAILSGNRQFSNILAHARASNALPVAYRDITPDLSLMERVAMAHQIAYYHSRDTTRTHREVWRFIYHLYKYLHSSSLPIGPLFTKAVVHASITRPLSENRFVSARRLIWVCHLVARVEGNEVAAQVENRFFVWRGDLIGRAKQVFVGIGGSKRSKAHVSTLKRLGLL